jgi:hypothetical protein
VELDTGIECQGTEKDLRVRERVAKTKVLEPHKDDGKGQNLGTGKASEPQKRGGKALEPRGEGLRTELPVGDGRQNLRTAERKWSLAKSLE